MRKYQLIQELVSLKDIQLISQIEALIKNYSTEKEDWWDDISDAEKSGILQGLADHEEGRVFTHEEVRSEIKEKFGL